MIKKEMIKKEMTLLTCGILLLVVIPTPDEVLDRIIELPKTLVEFIANCPIWIVEFLTEIPKTWTDAFTKMVEGDYK